MYTRFTAPRMTEATRRKVNFVKAADVPAFYARELSPEAASRKANFDARKYLDVEI